MDVNYKITWILILIFAFMATLTIAKPMPADDQAKESLQRQNLLHMLDQSSKQLNGEVIHEIQNLIQQEKGIRSRAADNESSDSQTTDDKVPAEDPELWFG